MKHTANSPFSNWHVAQVGNLLFRRLAVGGASWLMCALASFLIVGLASAADKPEKAGTATTNSVTGKWSYTLDVSLDTSLDFTAEFKQEGENVTGFVLVQELKTAIEKGKFKDGQLTFEIPREYGGVKFTSRYAGKLTGDKLVGKIVSGTAPVERTYEWSAKREKAPAKP
jgi:anti-sigma28 factor (negative regulator of flagellin synthesis)